MTGETYWSNMTCETYWYRAKFDVRSRGYDPYYESFFDIPEPKVSVLYIDCRVLKQTPKGVWLDTYEGRKFVLREARKRWACPTQEEALESLLARTRRRKLILEAQLKDVKIALNKYP